MRTLCTNILTVKKTLLKKQYDGIMIKNK